MDFSVALWSIFSIYIHIYDDEIWSGFPLTSSKLPPTSGESNWLNWNLIRRTHTLPVNINVHMCISGNGVLVAFLKFSETHIYLKAYTYTTPVGVGVGGGGVWYSYKLQITLSKIDCQRSHKFGLLVLFIYTVSYHS